jgi:hypothetical protein
MPYDIVTRLQDHPHTLVSDCRCIRCEAADEIEGLRAEIISTRAERDAAQTQADHLAKRLVQEARDG